MSTRSTLTKFTWCGLNVYSSYLIDDASLAYNIQFYRILIIGLYLREDDQNCLNVVFRAEVTSWPC